MSSTLLSFVGSQDPYSPKTKEEGPIFSLAKHLVENEQFEIEKIILLYTQELRDGAEVTQEWIAENLDNISIEQIQLVPVVSELSTDPVNLRLASEAARQAIDIIQPSLTQSDCLEFNASSGTPAMKSAWAILQASGYTSFKSRVWQVRNPHKMQPNQAHVFASDITFLKNEFDLKVVKTQLSRYNYSGILATLEGTPLLSDRLATLLKCAQYRFAFDFDKAMIMANQQRDRLSQDWIRDLSQLRQRDRCALIREIYFKSEIRLLNQEYSDFLILLFAFEESVLKYITLSQFFPEWNHNKKWKKIESKVWQAVENYKDGHLLHYLKSYRLENGKLLRIGNDFNRLIFLAILEYFAPENPKIAQLLTPLQFIDDYALLRNGCVHDLQGVSHLEDTAKIQTSMRKILKSLTHCETNPFETLNQMVREDLNLPETSL